MIRKLKTLLILCSLRRLQPRDKTRSIPLPEVARTGPSFVGHCSRASRGCGGRRGEHSLGTSVTKRSPCPDNGMRALFSLKDKTANRAFGQKPSKPDTGRELNK